MKRLADEAVVPALDMVRAGKSLLEASEATGISRPVIAERARAVGIPIRKSGVRGPDRLSKRGRPGNRYIDKDGYVIVYAPAHPWPRKAALIQEHIIVMELHLGRRIASDECVHHKDENRQNNVLDNLELMKRGAHSTLHRRQEQPQRDTRGRFAAGGRK